MKKSLLVFILSTIKLCINAQIVVEEAKPKVTLPEHTSVVVPFDSTNNTSPSSREMNSYIGKEIFFLDDGGEFFSDPSANHRIKLQPQLKYFVVLDKQYLPGRDYYDPYREDLVTIKSRYLYKIKEKGTDNIVYYDPELNNPFMPEENAFSVFDVIWVSYYNYLKAEYIGKKYAITHSKELVNPLSDYNTGEDITYKYNDIWTIDDVKVIQSSDGKNSYNLKLIMKNNTGNVTTMSPKSILLVDKKTYDEYIKQYGATMVKSAFEGDLKVGMPQALVRHVTKHYIKGDNPSIAKTSAGEEWTINAYSKTIFISFDTSGKVKFWREEEPKDIKMKVKVSSSLW